MRTQVLAILVLSIASSAWATEAFRPATVAEIYKELPKLRTMTVSRNGYDYAPGSSTGYKVSKGEICVRHPGNRVECLRIQYDGETLRMVDGLGNRELLN